ncbi:MAG: phenylalanine--tRNA ligase subunit alpha, partial [Oscillospiraceae bacterium]
MKEKIAKLQNQLDQALAEASNSSDLDAIRIRFLGKKGLVTDLMKELRDLTDDAKKEAGQLINNLKTQCSNSIAEAFEKLKAAELAAMVESASTYDVTLPENKKQGSYHPITLVGREVEDIFASMGFTIEEYPEIVDDYHCFEALNIPKHHPARDMQDTYYLDNGQLLKTHTSAAQNSIMKKYGAPLRAIFPGRCFRNESTDACHENTFFQM